MINKANFLPFGDYLYSDWQAQPSLPVCPVLGRYQRTAAPFFAGTGEEATCLFILRAGRQCTAFSGGKTFFCRSGDCFLLPAGRRAEWTPGGPMEYVMLELADRTGLLGDSLIRISGCPGAVEQACRLVQKMAQGMFDDPYDASAAAYALCMELRRAAEKPPRAFPPLVVRALKIFQTRYAYIAGASDAADLLGVSREHFNRVFTRNVGVTPGQYLRGIRIDHAKKLLAETSETVEIIAKATGFEGGNYFCRVFKSVTGETPGQYRRRAAKWTDEPPSSDIALY